MASTSDNYLSLNEINLKFAIDVNDINENKSSVMSNMFTGVG